MQTSDKKKKPQQSYLFFKADHLVDNRFFLFKYLAREFAVVQRWPAIEMQCRLEISLQLRRALVELGRRARFEQLDTWSNSECGYRQKQLLRDHELAITSHPRLLNEMAQGHNHLVKVRPELVEGRERRGH